MVDKNMESLIPSQNLRRAAIDFLGELDRRLFQGLRGTPYEAVRPFDLRVGIAAIRAQSTVSELARQLQVSRQAVHSAALRLKAMGMVDLQPSPTSGRDKIIVITAEGRQVQTTTMGFLGGLDEECEGVLGKAGYAKFRQQLFTLVAAMKLRELD
jgi:DNA-binding MarR family transcriptional regulator